MILLAIFVPPLAVFLATKNPVRALIALVLWFFFWAPGSIYAVMAVNEAKTGKQIRQSEKRILDAQR